MAHPEFGPDTIAGIEQWRTKWRADESPLADGTLPEAGPWDEGESVAKAVHSSRGKPGADFLNLLANLYRPRKVLELGTNLGISTGYFAAAMKAAGQGGVIHTIDASPYRLRLASQMHTALGLDNVVYHAGRFFDVLPELLEREQGFDMIFVDAQHDQKNTNRLASLIQPGLAPVALYLQNGVEVSEGMRASWNHMRTIAAGGFASSEVNGLGVVLIRNPEA